MHKLALPTTARAATRDEPARRGPRGVKRALLALLGAGLWLVHARYARDNADRVLAGDSTFPEMPDGIQRSWAMLSPWAPKGTYVPPPLGCAVTQVNLLQRHGARQPSGDDAHNYHAAVKKLLKVRHKIPRDSPLAFIKDYTYILTKDDLVPFGALQSSQHGERDFERYANLLGAEHIPFVRASGAQRVVDTAHNWTAGFAAASEHTNVPKLSVIISEKRNNSLDDDMCMTATEGKRHTVMWLHVYARPIAKRLNAWAPGAKLNADDVWNLMSVCPIETQLRQAPSPFCALFTKDEWAQFEYQGDVEKFYRTGYGNPLGPVQGVGYVNELLARLSDRPVRDQTSVNHTLDSDPATFPLGRAFYADFTHENLIIAVFAALGLFKTGVPLDPTHPHPAREWLASALVPFSARLLTERLDCIVDEDEDGTAARARGTYVRMFVNEAPVTLECAGGRKAEMCELGEFQDAQVYARVDGAGDWEKCFARQE